MNPNLRHQLRELDRALLALVDERVRLLDRIARDQPDVAHDEPACAPAIDDMLRRYRGPLEARELIDVFTSIDKASRTREASP